MIVLEDVDEDEDEDELITIPITITCIVLIVYILIGAGIFGAYEKDWSLTDGTYFSFVTISTIGFGDLVPGKDGFDKVGFCDICTKAIRVDLHANVTEKFQKGYN